jgi:hypothetical protein
LPIAVGAGRALHRVAANDEVRRLADELSPALLREGQTTSMIAGGRAGRPGAARRGRASEAVEHLGRARDLETERGATYFAASADADLAEALTAAGDDAGAEADGAHAHAVFDPLAVVQPV